MGRTGTNIYSTGRSAGERIGKKITHLIPTQEGNSLITVLPEQLQSPLLTAEWENRLKQVEHGELSPEDFMAAISDMVRELAATCAPVPGGEVLFPSGKESIGPCPRCGGNVTESKKGFFCENPSCRFALWKSTFSVTLQKGLSTPICGRRLRISRSLYLKL